MNTQQSISSYIAKWVPRAQDVSNDGEVITVYVSGPITGRPPEQAASDFREATRALKSLGYHVINPYDLGNAKWSWVANMEKCLEALMRCNAIYFLPGWVDSPGAQVESIYAQKLGLGVLSKYEAPRGVHTVNGWPIPFHIAEWCAAHSRQTYATPQRPEGLDDGEYGTADYFDRIDQYEAQRALDNSKRLGEGIAKLCGNREAQGDSPELTPWQKLRRRLKI